MSEFEKNCMNCRDCYCARNSERCKRCDNNFSLWTPQKWFVDWLDSLDSNSATECFTAVNILKERLNNNDNT